MSNEIFNWRAKFPIQIKGGGYKTLISKGDGGRERRRSKVATLRRTFSVPIWQLRHAEIEGTGVGSEPEKSGLFGFYNRHKGAYDSFLWNRPKGDGTYEQVRVRFERDDLTYEFFMTNRHNITVTFVEVFSTEI